MERERNPWEKTFYHRAVQTKIGQVLRAQYDEHFVSQPLPDKLRTLLLQLDKPQPVERIEPPAPGKDRLRT